MHSDAYHDDGEIGHSDQTLANTQLLRWMSGKKASALNERKPAVPMGKS